RGGEEVGELAPSGGGHPQDVVAEHAAALGEYEGEVLGPQPAGVLERLPAPARRSGDADALAVLGPGDELAIRVPLLPRAVQAVLAEAGPAADGPAGVPGGELPLPEATAVSRLALPASVAVPG